jgi:hypothetical protein
LADKAAALYRKTRREIGIIVIARGSGEDGRRSS